MHISRRSRGVQRTRKACPTDLRRWPATAGPISLIHTDEYAGPSWGYRGCRKLPLTDSLRRTRQPAEFG
jgi:hypothetical protein